MPLYRHFGGQRLRINMNPISDNNATALLGIERSQEGAVPTRRVRADIEGIRALAVLSVVVYHAFPLALRGGFVGVDLFFVISGYLIGGHLLKDIQAGRFSIRKFYAKRARRIFPALVVLLISIWAVGWVVLSAPEFTALGQQIAAAALFSNNILLWSQSGYFDVTALDKPLMHLWSLGIEEQFYLLVPLMLWASKGHVSGSIRWVARLGGMSLLATVFLSNQEYPATFYLLHTRFWELACGVLLAQAELRMIAGSLSQEPTQIATRRESREILLFAAAIILVALLQFGLGLGGLQRHWDAVLSHTASALVIVLAAAAAILADLRAGSNAWTDFRGWVLRNRVRLAAASSAAGMLLICGSLATLSSAYWPGVQTVFPVLGTALVIAAGSAIPAPNRFLALKPLTFIGGMSYPLYLWHWPLIVFWRQFNPNARAVEMTVPVMAAFLLAWLTKEIVEEPIRFGKLGLMQRRLPPIWPVVSGLVLIGLLGLVVVAANGIPSRFSAALRTVAEWSESNPDADWRVDRCYFYTSTNREFASECTPVKRPGVPLVLLWGDSHAADLYPGLANIQSTMNFDIVQWTAAGCAPTVTALVDENQTCPRRRAMAIRKLSLVNPNVVVLGGAWERYQELGRPSAEILGMVTDTIRYLQSNGVKRIVVFGPGPLWNVSLPVDLFRFMVRTRSDQVPERLGRVSDAIWQLDAAMAAQAGALNVQYVSVLDDFCDKSGCLTIGDRTLHRPDLLFRDRDHLTVSGSKVLIENARRQLFGGG